MPSMRKAVKYLKQNKPAIIVAEFNFQSDFRDRSSQLETLMASIAQSPEIEVIVLFDKEQEKQLERVTSRFEFLALLAYPVGPQAIEEAVRSASAFSR